MLTTSCKWGLHSRLQGPMLTLNFKCAHTNMPASVPLLNITALLMSASSQLSRRRRSNGCLYCRLVLSLYVCTAASMRPCKE